MRPPRFTAKQVLMMKNQKKIKPVDISEREYHRQNNTVKDLYSFI